MILFFSELDFQPFDLIPFCSESLTFKPYNLLPFCLESLTFNHMILFLILTTTGRTPPRKIGNRPVADVSGGSVWLVGNLLFYPSGQLIHNQCTIQRVSHFVRGCKKSNFTFSKNFIFKCSFTILNNVCQQYLSLLKKNTLKIPPSHKN